MLPKRRRPSRKPSHLDPSRGRLEAVEAAVKAAYLELIAEGEYPSEEKICKRIKVGRAYCREARAKLVDAGLVPVSDRRYAWLRDKDDPTAEVPDPPDAAEIQARIAEIRAEKEALPAQAPPVYVQRGRDHRPAGGRRRRIVA